MKYAIVLILTLLVGCECTHSKEEYPKTHYTKDGSITYLNDSIVVVRTNIKGMDNHETKIINLKKTIEP